MEKEGKIICYTETENVLQLCSNYLDSNKQSRNTTGNKQATTEVKSGTRKPGN